MRHHLRARQGCDRHRRRRHRHRLRGHVPAPRLPQPDPVRNSAAAARWTRQPDNPWPEWPKVYKLDYGQEEARPRFGNDPRSTCISTKRFVGDENGHVKEIHTVAGRVGEGDNGRLRPREVPAGEGLARRSWCCWRWAFSARKTRCSSSWAWSDDPRRNVQGRVWRVPTSVRGRLCRRRHAPRAEPGGVGDQRRPRAARECDRYLMGESRCPKGLPG